MEINFNSSPLDDALPATPHGGLLSVAIGDIVQADELYLLRQRLVFI